MIRRSFGTLLVITVAGAGSLLALSVPTAAASAGAQADGVQDTNAPTVTGPAKGGQGIPSILSTNFDLADVGYTNEEYFIEGEASAYEEAAPLRADGKWKVHEVSTAPYKTRVVVYRPADPADFNGTLFVEWLNVTAGFDTSPDWMAAHNALIRSGAAFMGVSAQAAGVQGGGAVLEGATEGGLKGGDPERYGSLSHPGDEYSYDIFTQAGLVATGDGDGVNPFAELDVKRVIAMGESQSAFRMTTYVNAVHPIAEVYDGFLVHSRGSSGASLGKSDGAGNDDASMPDGARIRNDLAVPVLEVQTETDLTLLESLAARQPDTKRFRLWEIAGSAHADKYTGTLAANDLGDGSAELSLLDPKQADGGVLRCSTAVNTGPTFAIVSAATQRLDKWVRDGTPPSKAARLETNGDEIVRDEHGNAEGGIRSPQVDVPLATTTGDRNSGGSFCGLFGTTAVFDAATVASLYPTRDDYVRQFDKSADATVDAGFWLEPNAENFKTAARQISLG
ncbi:MAG: alpha/beta hydrolase domain-containing protein [Acidimicrobiia bacterium]